MTTAFTSKTVSTVAVLRLCLAAFLALGLATLSGCGTNGSSVTAAPTGGNPLGRGAISGHAFGGLQPVVGATIQLYEVGTTGYTSAAKPILTAPVITDGGGGFSITSDYSCDAGSYVYITASGGNPGAGTNNNLALAAALGSCSHLLANAATTDLWINEVTTVATAYALAQFSGGTAFGATLVAQPGSSSSAPADNFATSSSNIQGIANAMAIASVLANNATGTSPGSNLNLSATPESSTVNTIADMIANCVDSTGGNPGDANLCGTLFTDATPTGGAAPSDTLQAALQFALHPGDANIIANGNALVAAIPATAPYLPYNIGPLNDFSIAIAFSPVVPDTTTTILSNSNEVAIDAYGNAWITNIGNETNAGSLSLVELGPTGDPIQAGSTPGVYGINSYEIPGGGSVQSVTYSRSVYGTSSSASASPVAIDLKDNAYVADEGGNYVIQVAGSGPTISLNGDTSAGSVALLALSAGGTGYTAPSAVFTGGGGSGAAATVNVNGSGVVTGLTLTNPGFGYIFAPTITISDATGIGAMATAAITSFTTNGGGGASANGIYMGVPGDGTTSQITAIAFDPGNNMYVANYNGTESTATSTCGTTPGAGQANYGVELFPYNATAPNFSSSNIVYDGDKPPSGSTLTQSDIASLALDNASLDTVSVGGTPTPIPGAPFIWWIAEGDGATYSKDTAFTSSNPGKPGALYQANTTSSGTAVAGCQTPLGEIGISSTTFPKVANVQTTTLAPNGTSSNYFVPFSNAYDVAIDSSNNIWATNQSYVDLADTTASTGSLTRLTPNYGTSATAPTQVPASTSFSFVTYTGGGATNFKELALAVDGANNVWLATNNTTTTVGAVSSTCPVALTSNNVCATSSLAPATGLTGYLRLKASNAAGVAIDASGNVWWTAFNSLAAPGTDVEMLVGAAVPVTTPLSLAVQKNAIATRP